ncbi:MAG: hypothetical protein K0U47_09645 [Epsilonproteobacteria bacterium]|nr:hypothetical protein [Campylobacterota bacterium]
MKWLETFKIALIEEDINTIDTLLKEIPEFKKIEDMRTAYSLIGEAKQKFEDEQKNIQLKMNKMQQAKKFLETKEREPAFDEAY